jgi:DNA polymerase-1
MLQSAGVAVEGPYADTMLAAQLLWGDGAKEAGTFTLAALVRDYLGEKLSKAQQGSDWTGPLTPAQLAYAAKDAGILLRLWEAIGRTWRRGS